MSYLDNAPWWLAGPVDEWPRVPWSGEAAPTEVVPEDFWDGRAWEEKFTGARDNWVQFGDDIKKPVTVVVHAAESVWDSVTHLFADPQPDAPPVPPILGPSDQSTVPAPDPPADYSGTTPNPQWSNVWEWATKTTHDLTPDVPVPAPITGTQVQHAIDVSAGQTIKALSGPINQVLNLSTLAADILATRIADTQTIIGALDNNHNLSIAQLHAGLDPIVNDLLPDLAREVQKLKDDQPIIAANVIRIMQKWATDNIHTPLAEDLAAEKAHRIAQVDDLKTSIPGIIAERVAAMGLAPVAAVAAIAAQLGPLVTESEECTKPMCETMGPKTNLGKLLKALSLASEAAFIADVLAMRESDVVDLIQKAVGRLATIVNDFENAFQPGAETVGGFIKNTIESAV